jgi:response regulator RpfG family c-di-GMP phosphodiesterase
MEKILFIDDNENILESLKRQLRGKFDVHTATGGQRALDRIDAGEKFAIIISDMKMPGMDGIQLLEAIRTKAPNSTRLMLTGNIDQTTAVQAVNKGNVFRFLNKPIDPIALESALSDAAEIYRLRTAEQELLNNTLKGVVEMLAELLALVDPNMYGQVNNLKLSIKEVCKQFNIQDSWEIEVAALLSKIGELALPLEIRLKIQKNEKLSEVEQNIYSNHPEAAFRFLKSIPRLGNVAEIVKYQAKNNDGTGFPVDTKKGEEIPVGARILRVLNEVAVLTQSGLNSGDVFKSIISKQNKFDNEVIEAVHAALLNKERQLASLKEIHSVEKSAPTDLTEKYSQPENCTVQDLKVGYVTVKDIRAKNGVLILTAGNQISEITFDRINNYHNYTGIKEPLMVLKPANKS